MATTRPALVWLHVGGLRVRKLHVGTVNVHVECVECKVYDSKQNPVVDLATIQMRALQSVYM